MSNYLVEIDAWTGAAVETLRFATTGITTRPTDTPPNTYYQPRISDPGAIARGLGEGASEVDFGAMILNAVDGGLDPLFNYGVDGRRIVIRDYRDPSQSVANAPIVFQGILDRVDTSDAWREVRLVIRDRLSDLQEPLLTEKFAGTTIAKGPTAEGTEDLKDRIKPRVWGNVQNMAPVLANAFDLIFLASASAVQSITVYDGALPLVKDGDYPTIAALQAATVVPGHYATCLAKGSFRLGGSAVFAITCDVVEGASVAQRSSARIVERILTAFEFPVGDRVQSTFDALHARNAAEIGVLVGSNSTAISVISQILEGVGAAIVPDAASRLGLVFRDVPSGTPVASYGMRDIIGQEQIDLGNDGVPTYKVTQNYGRVWQTMGSGDVAGSVTDERKAYLKEEIRQAVVENAAILIAHPQATERTVDSLFVNRADAEARAAEILAIEGSQRLKIQITVPEDKARNVPLGSAVMVTLPRFGLDTGRLFRVENRRDDFRKRTVTLTAWR